MQIETEAAFVSAFIVKERRDRYLYLLSSSRRRERILSNLYHCRDIDPRYSREVTTTGGTSLEEQLRMAGAPDECYVISTDDNHDGRELDLRDVLEEYVAGNAMLISCVPGRLGCFVDEYGSAFILQR